MSLLAALHRSRRAFPSRVSSSAKQAGASTAATSKGGIYHPRFTRPKLVAIRVPAQFLVVALSPSEWARCHLRLHKKRPLHTARLPRPVVSR